MGRSRTTHAGCALTEKQDRFVRLIAEGVSNREACRIVGINRRTETRWRLGHTIRNTAGKAVHYPPVRILTPPKRHPRYLSLDERMVIADLRRGKRTVREIARELGRSPATVSRELRRNVDHGRCLPRSADRAATERIARPRARRVMVDTELRAVVVDLLGKAVESGAGRPRAARAVRRPACPAPVHRVDLPGDLRPGRARNPPSQAPAPTPAASRSRPRTTRPAHRDDDDRRPSGRGGRPNPGRALGGRLHHGSREPVSDRHSRRAAHPLPDPRPRPDRQTDRRSDASGHQRHAGTTARPAAPHADLGSGQGTGDAPANQRTDRHSGVLLRRPATGDRFPGCVPR